ncbi:MAG: leucine-rich repeat domain-containing protein, partial [Saprospiraceae bacterium]|nr:leucine-rich repeat domain-containing protein [Saprospiraceae bacterium]
MSELALKLIRENIEKHRRGEDATFLDLGNCGITEVPEEIGECVWVERLTLSKDWVEFKGDIGWINKVSQNQGPPNIIRSLKYLNRARSLKYLILSNSDVDWNISNLSPLSDLEFLEHLYCQGNQIADLSPISELKKLKVIHLYHTQITNLLALKNLTNLQLLHIQRTNISDLSPLLNLHDLRYLYCLNTQVSDLNPLKGAIRLELLNCGNTNIESLSPLSDMNELRMLGCFNTKVTDLSPLIGLKKLESLTCRNSPIVELSPLESLNQLKRLDISGTLVSDFAPICKLKSLESLNVSNTQILDFVSLKKIINLWHINLASTPIIDLSPISKSINLKSIDVSNTQVFDIRPFLPLITKKKIPVKWQTWEEHVDEDNTTWQKKPAILVKDCPLIIPPVEFAQESPQAVRDYFEELGDDGRKLNEVKVIFLGEASAGKTSLVKRLFGENFDSKESQTHGIRIRKVSFKMDDSDSVTAHLWDFGGQEVMHATHQFFLSQRSVYVLLLNSRNDDQAEKWLKHAASFGGRSPVLVVLNKIDENPSFQVDNKRLKEKYPQIRDFFRLSAKTDKGMGEFREALRREIDRADTRRTPFPKHWLAVKEHFSNMEADYIESAEYQRVCEENGVTRQFSQDVLLQFLHDLGVVINFRNLKNFDTQILNPLWLTNGVYRIVNSKIVAEDTGGLLYEDDFDAVINDPRYKEGNTSDREFEYPKNKLQYIVRVMQEFELCFQLDPRTYVVPQLLPVQEPEFKTEGALLHFVIHFPEFLPDSIFPRLMVKLHTFIERSPGNRDTPGQLTMWRTGMVLHKPNIFKALARVRWDKEDQKILVDVCGEERRRFLSFIRETVKEIVDDFTNLEFDELVPIPESKDTEEYDYLVEAEKAGEKEVFVKSLKKRVSIADLLDGVEEPAMRDEVEQLPVKAFVSYAHKDLEYLKELRTALSPLMRLQKLQIWDDRDIDAGDEWEKVIFQQLEESDIVLCLVSADFVASDFCYKEEFSKALEAHRNGEKTIIPVMLRKTDWQDLPLAEIQGAPGEWITSAQNKDEAWTKVSEALRPALARAKQRKKVLL